MLQVHARLLTPARSAAAQRGVHLSVPLPRHRPPVPADCRAGVALGRQDTIMRPSDVCAADRRPSGFAAQLADYSMGVAPDGREGIFTALASAPLFAAMLPTGGCPAWQECGCLNVVLLAAVVCTPATAAARAAARCSPAARPSRCPVMQHSPTKCNIL